MNNNINVNLRDKIEEFPGDIKMIALEIVDSLNNKNKSLQTIEDMIDRKINNLVNKGV